MLQRKKSDEVRLFKDLNLVLELSGSARLRKGLELGGVMPSINDSTEILNLV